MNKIISNDYERPARHFDTGEGDPASIERARAKGEEEEKEKPRGDKAYLPENRSLALFLNPGMNRCTAQIEHLGATFIYTYTSRRQQRRSRIARHPWDNGPSRVWRKNGNNIMKLIEAAGDEKRYNSYAFTTGRRELRAK